MADIDDEIEQGRAHYLSDGQSIPNTLAQEAFKKGFPVVGWAYSFWQSAQQRENQRAFNNWVLDLIRARDVRLDELPEELAPELGRVAALCVERILWGASEKKARRFAAVLADTLVSTPDEQGVEDAAYFIRAIDELSEDDIKVLGHLYEHQKDLVHEKHQVDYNSFFNNHRNEKLLRSVGSLGMTMEDFYGRCGRLNGYGLALPLERNTNFDPSEFAFRITWLGKKLIEMLARSSNR